MSNKQIVIDALERMPESLTLQEISEEIAILAAIRKGQAEIAAGRGITHEEAKRRAATWTTNESGRH